MNQGNLVTLAIIWDQEHHPLQRQIPFPLVLFPGDFKHTLKPVSSSSSAPALSSIFTHTHTLVWTRALSPPSYQFTLK